MYSPCFTGVHKGLLCTQVADVTRFPAQHFNLMYAYNAMASYFARDNVALLGFSKVRLFILRLQLASCNNACAVYSIRLPRFRLPRQFSIIAVDYKSN